MQSDVIIIWDVPVVYTQTKYMQAQQVHSDTNLDLKGCPFIPIAGILELVNRTLVDRIPMLT